MQGSNDISFQEPKGNDDHRSTAPIESIHQVSSDEKKKAQSTATSMDEPPATQEPNTSPHLRKGLVSPENTANAFSRITLWWLNGLFSKGYKRRIEEEDIYFILKKNQAKVLCGQLTLQWELEKKRAAEATKKYRLKGKDKEVTPSLIRATFWTFWTRYYDCVIGLELGGKH